MDLHSPLAVNGAVVESLLELRQNPAWHGYGGFKKGYLAQVRTMVENKLPGRRFKLSHIRCEVNFLKNKYFAISDMVSSGGFAWDEEKMMLICDQNKYDEWVMVSTYISHWVNSKSLLIHLCFVLCHFVFIG